MADIEKSPIIQFRTDDSGMLKAVGSVKELKLAISQLKDDIVKMRQSGQDTTQTVEDVMAAIEGSGADVGEGRFQTS